MKKIEAVIRPEQVSAVRRALERVGYSGLMIGDINGHGAQKGKVEQWRGETYKVELLAKTKIDIIVKDSDLAAIVTAIKEAAKTGQIGDGKIFVSDIENVIRIRTGEEGNMAL
ncbi:MAG TPA: P-II family nitrogen regulator [Patescibacteria group bacterium]|nr:P-II family nitrogen regulator [Patescibacteria group bacterium]